MDKELLNTIFEILQISLALLSFLYIFNILIKKYLYKYDSKKQKNTINSLNILIILTIVFIIIEEFSHKNVALISQIFLIILIMKIVYHSFGYYFIKKFGKLLYIEEQITSPKILDEIYDKFSSKIIQELNNDDINNSNLKAHIKDTKLKLELNKHYILKNGLLYKVLEKYVSNKTTSLIDIGLIILLSIFTVALIIPIIKPLNEIFNNDYMFAVFAFLGAYVLNPAFPDMYAFFTFVRNKNIDLEKFISFVDNGKIIKGRIIQMTTSHIILKDHVQGISLTIPNMNLHNKVINNFDDINSHLGLKRTLTYVVDLNSYNKDFGIKLKTIFKNILNDFELKSSLISKQKQYNIWLSSDDNGVKITLWYFIKDIEQEEKIKLDLEDFILYEATKNGFDLTTPKLLDITNKFSLNSNSK
jgi:hypothetical protein